jgi:prepilin-type N-terminal cleavage/methylation domain-containing protein
VLRRLERRGFSLIELMIGLAIAGIILAMGMTGLGKAKTAGNSRGLATAVSSEFKFAREKAIATGSPVAVVIPARVSRSLFWLEGTTEPTISRAVNYEGDYPRGAITVATYNGPTFQKNATMPGFKAEVWGQRLATWLPNRYHNDFVIVFTPNGSVITNDLPSAEGSYRVIVGTGAKVSGGSDPGGSVDYVSGNSPYFDLQASGEPYTVAISLGGAVESDKGLLGYTGSSVNTQGAPDPSVPNPPHPEYDWVAKKPKILFGEVTPPAEDVDGRLAHVIDKGEYLTLEVFAQSGDGKPIFADWDDIPETQTGPQFMGAFSVPDGDPERMEFYPEFTVDGKVEKNVWRSVWTWTPPKAAEAGDRYTLEVKVKDAKAQHPVEITDIPPVIVAPPGEVVFERRVSGRWHLFTMWADGSRQRQLTEGPHNYTCTSATADGKMIAYQRNNEVWVMNFDGTGQTKIADGTHPAISPTGGAIAFMNGDKVWVKRIDRSGGSPKEVDSIRTDVVTAPSPANRLTFSHDGRHLYFTNPTADRVAHATLAFSGNSISVSSIQVPAADIPNHASNAKVGGLYADRIGEYVYYHGDDLDPYLGRYRTAGGSLIQPNNPGDVRVSVGQFETYPAPSPDGNVILFCESGTIYRCAKANFTAAGTQTALTNGRRPTWIKQRGTL